MAIRFFLIFLLGCVIWLSPHAPEVSEKGWHLLAVFIATIFGIILRPIAMGGVALIAIAVATTLGAMTMGEALSGFGNDQIWLIVVACCIARGFIKTGLGQRVAYMILCACGKTPIGIAYGFLCTDLILSPTIPSSTARAGGILYPIVKSLSETLGSRPDDGTERKIGAFLTLVTVHGISVSSAMFITAMGANPILVRLAEAEGVEMTWGLWALAASLPGLCSLLVIPLLINFIYPPTLKQSEKASLHAKEALLSMGPIKKSEWVMLGTFFFLLILWIFGKTIGVHATATAIFGLSILLCTNVLTWNDVLAEGVAWDTLVWFSVLMGMAYTLGSTGVIHWYTGQSTSLIEGLHWRYALVALVVLYFYSHYFFASAMAHATAMFAPFLIVGLKLGIPPLFLAYSLAFFNSLSGAFTQYSSGHGAVLFASRYVPLKDWLMVGFLLSFAYLLIWLGLGSLWWHFILPS